MFVYNMLKYSLRFISADEHMHPSVDIPSISGDEIMLQLFKHIALGWLMNQSAASEYTYI